MKVSVIGQGYVGLNLSIFAASVGHSVIGYDLDEKLILKLKNGITHVPGISKELLTSLIIKNNYLPSSNETSIQDSRTDSSRSESPARFVSSN
jgi:UDP-N-acetyl-D-glucosamine dehydrogenase